MHPEQVGHLVTIEYAVPIFIERVVSDSHLLDPLTADRLRMLIHLHHHFVLADQILHVVLTVLHLPFQN